ncbi:alpha/beta fold hydrolase [Jannaschia seohaensis]|uniref:alpha/beta fold hydrolase n=1 Tax=Jannaschia seohaensis TaxID=475081 RepID=UPI000D6DBA62|nr:alpha/beta hydrolase [Jannaschia seohaensis]
MKTPTVFLPGAGGSAEFWRPLATELVHEENQLFSWPGLGNEGHSDKVRSLGDLVDLVAEQIKAPVNVVAQSMGGVVAVLLARRKPELVKRMVLVATSAGIEMTNFGASDWRPEYRAAFPNAAHWIECVSMDLTEDLRRLNVPILLIWGDRDPISPVSVGEHLERLLPAAVLHVEPGGDHDVGVTHAHAIAARVRSFLDGQ